MKTYFIEHKETRLWYYMELGYSPIYCFGGWQTGRQMCIKHGWTNNPDTAKAFDTPDAAMFHVKYFINDTPEGDMFVTEHLFL